MEVRPLEVTTQFAVKNLENGEAGVRLILIFHYLRSLLWTHREVSMESM